MQEHAVSTCMSICVVNISFNLNVVMRYLVKAYKLVELLSEAVQLIHYTLAE